MCVCRYAMYVCMYIGLRCMYVCIYIYMYTKVSSYLAQYPVCRTDQSTLHFTPGGRPVH